MFKRISQAAVCVCLLCGCAAKNNSFSIVDETDSLEYTDTQDFEQTDEYEAQRALHDELSEDAADAAMRQLSFARETSVCYLNAKENQNTVYAPLNAWFALAALSAASSGETKNELLNLMNVESEEQLRSDFEALWKAANLALPEAKEHNAVSLWLCARHTFLQDQLQTLKQQFHLSSFAGRPGSKNMNKTFRDWINDHVKGLKKDELSDLQPDQTSVMSLISAADYSAAWEDGFDPKDTEIQLFHGITSDSAVYLMRNEEIGRYYRGTHFAAVQRRLKDAGYMYLILPDQEYDLKDIYEDDEMWQMLQNGEFLKSSWEAMIYTYLPAFDISVQNDLSDLLKTLGINAAFDTETADFTEISDEKKLSLSKVQQAAIVSVDENGICSAVHREPEKSESYGFLTIDRQSLHVVQPFVYVVTGDDGSVRLIGTVYDLADVERQWTGQFPGEVKGVAADHTAVLPKGTIHYFLPEGMESAISENGELNIFVSEEPQYGVTLAFDRDLGLCGTGMREETRKVNGRYVTLESMSTQSWEYAFFAGNDQEPKLVMTSNMGIRYRDLADQILHSIHIEN